LAVVALWYVLSATGALTPEVLASPVDVVKQFGHLVADGEMTAAIAASGQRVVYGYALGAVIAIVLALLAGLLQLGEDLIDSTVGMVRMIPWVGLIPLFIIWFGIDEEPKIALVALGVLFPLYINLYNGIRGVDNQLVEAGRTLGLSRFGLIRHVILPGALPGLLVGVRFSLGTAWLALVFAEQVNANAGIGYLMNNAREFFQTDVIVVCLVVYAILGLLSDWLVRLLQRWLLSWQSSFIGA
jgi:sulfonate transport system permease protein